MKIACLAWGSLLWKTGPLVLASRWYDDGPVLPVEFARVGDKGELSTVLCDGAGPQRTWWALLDAGDLGQAREQLREREQIDPHHPEWIGSLPSDTDTPGPWRDTIGRWLAGRPLDAVVWTALPPRYSDEEGLRPTSLQAVDYLRGLEGEKREHAEDYLRRVPGSMATANRRVIEDTLGWTALSR